MLAPSSGGVIEPHTIHMPYLFSAQCMLTDSVTRVSHVIIMMHDPQPACQVKVAHWTPRTHIAHTLQPFPFFQFFFSVFDEIPPLCAFCTQYRKHCANDAEELERDGLFKKSKARIAKLNALNLEPVFGITSMSDRHPEESGNDVKVTDEDGFCPAA